jgi:hypothetical protein
VAQRAHGFEAAGQRRGAVLLPFLGALLPLAVGFAVLAPLTLLRQFPASYDTDSFYAPMQAFLHRELAAGNWPTWNPYAFGGMPFAGEPQSGVFYPPALLANGLLAPANALIALCLFHYGIALLGTYLLCRRRGLAVAPATYAALAYGTSGLLLSRTQALTLLAGGGLAARLPVGRPASRRDPPPAGRRPARRVPRVPGLGRRSAGRARHGARLRRAAGPAAAA